MVLRGLKDEEIFDFERDVQLAQGTADDLALISSFRDLGDHKGLKRSGSEAYWNRCGGDFECSPSKIKDDQPRTENEYWDDTVKNNDDTNDNDDAYFDDLSGAC